MLVNFWQHFQEVGWMALAVVLIGIVPATIALAAHIARWWAWIILSLVGLVSGTFAFVILVSLQPFQ